MAEGEGFEPPSHTRWDAVFKTAAFSHSATPPRAALIIIPCQYVPSRSLTEGAMGTARVLACYLRNGIPIAFSRASASSSVFAVVQKVMSIPRRRST